MREENEKEGAGERERKEEGTGGAKRRRGGEKERGRAMSEEHVTCGKAEQAATADPIWASAQLQLPNYPTQVNVREAMCENGYRPR